MLPLAGIRVLDLSRLLPGPYCSLLLADMGAEVIKVEDTAQGDYIRFSPPYQKNESALFLALNRNKRSMRLNLKDPDGVALFHKLAARADVVLESFRPGVTAKLGIGYEALRATNPGLVYCAITGYGQDGPYAAKAGHDLNYNALAGLQGITGIPGRLALPGGQVADVGGGALSAAVGILAALLRRQTTGQGAFVDTSMTDGVLAFVTMHLGAFFADGERPGPATMTLNGAYPCYNVYETADERWFGLGALEPKFWQNFCAAVGRDDLRDKAFDRGEGPESAIAAVRALFKTKALAEWTRISDANDFCGEPVLSFDEIENHPLHQARGNFFEIDHPTEGRLKQVRTPIRFQGDAVRTPTPPPGIGEHTDEVLGEAGVEPAEIARLRQNGSIA